MESAEEHKEGGRRMRFWTLLAIVWRYIARPTRAAGTGRGMEVIADLLKIIMATVRAHSGGDSKAEMELNQEELARREHFALLQNVLVADLIDPDSPIQPDELASVFLGADEDDLLVSLTISCIS